ncbi:MAG: Gfo/Idh/MocA family protein [Acidimicrobiales bacterium]
MTRIGVGVIGFGWMGQAHSRSVRRIATLFPEREYQAELVVCADSVAARRDTAVGDFGFAEATDDWRKVVEHPDVDAVFVCAPNMLHVEMCQAAAAGGNHIFCEKPVGGTPDQTRAIEAAGRRAGVIGGVGYNYRWAPLVRYAKELIDGDAIGEVTLYRGRFFSMYGNDPLGLLSWRFLQDQAGYGVSTDILSHAVDLAHFLAGPITRVVGTGATFVPERPLPRPGLATHYDRGAVGDPTGPVTNEDYAAALVEFASGTRGTFEACRTLVGPQSQMAFDVYGTKGALAWNLETMNELRLCTDATEEGRRGYTTIHATERHPYHGSFVPGEANGIGFEDLVVIEDHEFLRSVAAGRQHVPGFAEALAYVRVQDAWLRSWRSGCWEDV